MKYILWIFLLFALLIMALIYLFLFTKVHMGTIYSYMISVNITTILYYGLDKLLAKMNRVRIPEIALHVMEFMGGSPAALVAQQLFWHKSTKRAYQAVFWLIVLIQVGMAYMLLHTDILKSIF